MKIYFPIVPILYSVSLMIIALLVQAAELTPQAYVTVDVEVRELTLNGMTERLNLLSNGQSEPEMEALIDQTNRGEINRAYSDNGTTAAAHAAYGSQHAAEISEWLNANTDWQQHYDWLADQFESLSNQLDALRLGN